MGGTQGKVIFFSTSFMKVQEIVDCHSSTIVEMKFIDREYLLISISENC